MKKSLNRKNAEHERPRRLTLSRETIQVLADPALLQRAKGGTGVQNTYDPISQTTTEGTGCP